MAAATTTELARGVYRLTFWDATVIDAEADVEVEIKLTALQAKILAKANPAKQKLHFVIGTETGAPDVTLNTIERSADGTNWFTWENFTDKQFNAAFAPAPWEIVLTKPFIYGSYFRLQATLAGAGLDGTNKFAASTMALDVVVDDLQHILQ